MFIVFLTISSRISFAKISMVGDFSPSSSTKVSSPSSFKNVSHLITFSGVSFNSKLFNSSMIRLNLIKSDSFEAIICDIINVRKFY